MSGFQNVMLHVMLHNPKSGENRTKNTPQSRGIIEPCCSKCDDYHNEGDIPCLRCLSCRSPRLAALISCLVCSGCLSVLHVMLHSITANVQANACAVCSGRLHFHCSRSGSGLTREYIATGTLQRRLIAALFQGRIRAPLFCIRKGGGTQKNRAVSKRSASWR